MMNRPQHPPKSEPVRDVLYVVSLFPCWSETFIVREINALKEQGLEVRIASLKPHSEAFVHQESIDLVEEVLYPSSGLSLMAGTLRGLARHPLRNLGWLGRLCARLWRRPSELFKSLATLALTLDLADRLSGRPPSRIHAHWATYPSTAAMILADNLDVPFSFTSHAHDIFVHNHLLRDKLERADFAATISNFNIDFLRNRLGELPITPAIVHCGVDPTEFRYAPDEREPGLIGSVGRLDEIKGFRYLIKACERLRDRGVDFRCRIVGDGPQRAELKALIDAAGLSDRIELLGAQPQDEVRALLRRLSVFVLPSVRDRRGNMDGIPVALMEAMALGTPVISTTVSGIPELIAHQHSGWLCTPGDDAELAQGLETLLRDAAQRTDLARHARAKVESEFDCRREAKKLAERFKGTPCESAAC